MPNDYYLDLERYSLQRFQEELEQGELLPGRIILKEKIEERMDILRNNGVDNLQQLQSKIKTPKKAAQFAEETGLNIEYIKILRREVNSLTPPPTPLNKFPDISPHTVDKLTVIGIKNTYQLFLRIKTPEEREELAKEIGVNREELLTLTKLTDLSRVKWVGPVFARIILESGADTLEKLRKANPPALYSSMHQLNQERGYTRSRFVENDLKMCIKFAQDVPLVIQY